MTTIKNDIVETLIVDFYDVEAGWLFFKLTLGTQIFESRFSEVYDPLFDFKHWLEAIALNVQQTSFTYDTEGDEIIFDFERVCWDREILTISEAYEKGQIFVKGKINRKQIVNAFYLGLLNFANSDKFKSNQWEVEYIKERLCKALNLNEHQLVETLIELDKKELGQVLFNANPVYSISFPSAKDKNEEWNLFLDTKIQDKKLPEEHTELKTPYEWNIPDDYDFWQVNKKKEFIIECINNKTYGCSGTKIIDFHSDLIEQYLTKNKI